MSFNKEARTAFANRIIVVSDLFNFHFRDTRFSGAAIRKVLVQPQNLDSTGGGRMARESIVLKPVSDHAGGGNIVAGFLDIGASEAELRTFGDLKTRHHQRFGNLTFDLDETEYDAFLAQAKAFLEREEFSVRVAEPAPEPGAPSVRAQAAQVSTPAAPAPARPVRNIATGTVPADDGPSHLVVALAFVFGLVVGCTVTYIMMRG